MGRSAEEALRKGRGRMLCDLNISNLAVVEDVTIRFDGGLNVMTGSTGTGKSIILAAVDLLSGSRAKRSLIRKGCEELSVEGVFSISGDWPMRREIGLEDEDDCVSVKRQLFRDGRSRIWINGTVSTNSAARKVADSLLELHGQHRHQELLDQHSHIRYLDAGGGYSDTLDECNRRISEFREVWTSLQRLREEMRENREREDFLRFQLRELEALGLEPGIDRELEQNMKIVKNRHLYDSHLERSIELISEGEGAVTDGLVEIEDSLAKLSSIEERWDKSRDEVSQMRISLLDIARDLERSRSDGESGEADMESMQQRLASIQKASRKYGLDCDGLIGKREDIRRALDSIDSGSDDILETSARLERIKGGLVPFLEKLTEKRMEYASKLERKVTRELSGLGMKGAEFRVDFAREQIRAFEEESDEIDLSPGGWDRVEFMVRTNVGEEMHPLADVASGGELSRITLVLKKELVSGKGIPTLVFDEIDTGLGADMGAVVAEKIRELSGRFQVICITHLPQVAALGDRHIKVCKEVKNGRTVTTAKVLDPQGRASELARMIGGDGKLQKELAAELLENVKSARSSVG